MDLETFIRETLIQISKGVESANVSLKGTPTVVNPRNVTGRGGYQDAKLKVYGYIDHSRDQEYFRPVELVEFDVAVHASEETGGKSGAGIFVAAIGIGAQENKESTSSTMSRIKFQIPIALPSPLADVDGPKVKGKPREPEAGEPS